MYIKLMVRGLLRHKKSGLRLFLLLALCSMVIMFCLAFRDSFGLRYRQFGIDTSTADLQIVALDSPKNQNDVFGNKRGDIALFKYDQTMQDFLHSLPAISAIMPVIETSSSFFELNGDATGYYSALIGVDPDLLFKVLPGVKVIEGSPKLNWDGPGHEVPLFRPLPYDGEEQEGVDSFERKDFKPVDSAWNEFKLQVIKHYPAFFPTDIGIPLEDDLFLDAMNKTLERNDLLSLEAMPSYVEEGESWRLDDERSAVENLQLELGQLDKPSARQLHNLKVARKRLLQALMPKGMRPVWDILTTGISYTMVVPPAKSDQIAGQPLVIPVKPIAFVQNMPLFSYNFYCDTQVLHDYLQLDPDDYTAVMIKLEDNADKTSVKNQIESWLASQQISCVVKDSESLGQLFLPTALAFDIVALVIVVLFLLTLAIFVSNTVSLALIKRKREIGTIMALGLSPLQNAVLIFGETALLVFFAWLGGAFGGSLIQLLLSHYGLSGMMVFPESRLYFVYSPLHALQALAVILPVALLASIWALRRLGSLRAIDLLKEAA